MQNPKLGDIAQGWEIGHKQNHKVVWHSCLSCGKERWVRFLNSKPVVYHCKACVKIGSLNHKYRGVLTNGGYVYVKIYSDNPYFSMANSVGYIGEHRLVMAEHLGRVLEKWEIVHHLNGIKNDNSVENLQLLAGNTEHAPYNALQKEAIQLKNEVVKWKNVSLILAGLIKKTYV